MKVTQNNLNFGTTAIPATGVISSQPISLWQCFGFAVQVFWTGTPTGIWTLNGSTDLGYTHPSGIVTGVTNWSTIAGSTVNATGASGNFVQNYEGSYFLWFQVIYTATSGTGTIASATYSTKGV